MQIDSSRLTLRPFARTDAEAASANSRQPIVAHFMSDMVLDSPEQASGWIEWIATKCNTREPCQVLAIERKADKQVIGLVGVAPKQEIGGEIEILFAIADGYQNNGYATEAGKAMIRWTFEDAGKDMLSAIVKPENKASRRVIEKLGFVYLDTRRLPYDGQDCDFDYFRLYRAETAPRLERMDDFFIARADGYDEHMLTDVKGCAEGYERMAELIAPDAQTLLDLGCGTGLELGPIFRLLPNVHVTGIDLTQAMLDKLKAKYPDRHLTLINGSYFDVDFGEAKYNAAVSFETLHHFTHAEKLSLYKRVYAALKEGGRYVECDYMVLDQAEENFYFAQNKKIRAEQGIGDGEFYHYDTPCTIDNQIKLLHQAGFSDVRKTWQMAHTTLILAQK